MTRLPTVGEIKAHYRQLVAAVGGVEAAAASLTEEGRKVSHQRISHLQSPNNDELPPLLHVIALEAIVGRPIVTGAVARAIQGDDGGDLLQEVVAAVERSSRALTLIHDMDRDGHRDAGEIRAVQSAAEQAYASAARLKDVAGQLTPGPSLSVA